MLLLFLNFFCKNGRRIMNQFDPRMVGEFSLAQWNHVAPSSSSNATSRNVLDALYVRVQIEEDVSSPDIESKFITRRKCRGKKRANISKY